MEDFPTPNYADQYPTDAIRASFGLNLASMPDLQSLRWAPAESGSTDPSKTFQRHYMWR